MQIVPRSFQKDPIRHFTEGASLATSGSASFAAPGTGLAYIPMYCMYTSSAVASLTYYNGTGGSALFTIKTMAGGTGDFFFWEEPSRIAANKAAVLESNDGIGVHDFHVYAIVTRAGAGQSGLGQ